MLEEFVAVNRDEIIARCRAKVSTRSDAPPLEAKTDHGVPVFLDQLVDTLHRGLLTSPEIERCAVVHGHNLLLQGFTLSQVVHDYGDVCQSITDLAVELDTPINTNDFRTLNHCLDDAIANAVTEHARAQHESTLDGEAARARERLGFFAHELRNLTQTAIVAFSVLKTGNVGVAGSTGTVLHRSLMGLSALIHRSLAEIRRKDKIEHRQQFPLSGFIAEVAAAATLEATSHGVRLVVMSAKDDVAIEGDRQVLAAVVRNLLQNAFKFTRPQTTVTLRVGATAERVLIEVEDECGGLPGGNVHELGRPFEQRSADRTGLGLGLAFSRRGAEANNGRLTTRNLPDKGCVFTVNLPRVPVLPATDA